MRRALALLAATSLVLALAACARRPTAGTSAPAADGKPGAAESASTPAPTPAPLSYELRMGQATFRHHCQTCHGETGAGDGFNAFNLDPHPRDLSDPAFQKRKTDVDLIDTIRRGGAGVGLSALMPPWGRTLSDAQIDEVVLYVRSLRKQPG